MSTNIDPAAGVVGLPRPEEVEALAEEAKREKRRRRVGVRRQAEAHRGFIYQVLISTAGYAARLWRERRCALEGRTPAV